VLTQKVFANMRRIGKGFLGVDTPLFDGMLVPQQVQDVKDAANDEDDVNEVSDEPTPPLPTPATTPPPSPTQEHDKIAQALELTKDKAKGQKVGEEEEIKNFRIKEIEEG
nr:hypothetical protein [Tanacetum cinerariifolium]